MPKVSVIILLHNSERFITKCVEGLFGQTLDDIEYVFVDDGSTDRTIEMIEESLSRHCERKPEVKIIRLEKNEGQAKARKIGVGNSTGEYVIHCDSDDWIDLGMYQAMYETAEKNLSDLVISDYYFSDGEKEYYWGQKCKDKEEIVRGLLNNRISGALWNKMIRREILDDSFIFPEENMCEDFVFTIQYLLRSTRIDFVEKPLYHYVRHKSAFSMSFDSVIEKSRQIRRNMDTAFDVLKESGEWDKYRHDIVHQKLYVKNNLLPVIEHQYKSWRHTYKEINKSVLFCKSISLREKCVFIIAYLGLYPLYSKIVK